MDVAESITLAEDPTQDASIMFRSAPRHVEEHRGQGAQGGAWRGLLGTEPPYNMASSLFSKWEADEAEVKERVSKPYSSLNLLVV